MAITITNVHDRIFQMRPLLTVRAVAVSMLLAVPHAYAGDWKITPSIDLRETYTDNVRLASDGNEKSDFITQISPGISVTGTGARLKLNARYTMQNIFYASESDAKSLNHQLNGNATAELWEDIFFVDGKASISQQNTSNFGSQALDNTNITSSRSNVVTYSISPYIHHHLKNFASTVTRLTHDSVSSDSAMSDSQSDRLQFDMTSGRDFGRLGWGLHYYRQKIDSTSQSGGTSLSNNDSRNYSADLSYRLTPQFRLTATAGQQKNSYQSLTGKSSGGTYWNGGFVWTPSQRTSISANAGHQFYGDSYAFKIDHRSRRTFWSINYSEDITSTREQFLSPTVISTAEFLVNSHIFDALPEANRLAAAEAFVSANGLPLALAENVNYFSNRYFLQKRLQASVSLTGVRNTLILSLFNSQREAQTSQTADSLLLGPLDLSLNDDTRSTGVNLLWNWRIAPHTNANLNAGVTRTTSNSGTDRQDDTKTLRASLTQQFGSNLNGMIELRHNERDSSQSTGEYSENAITASVNMRF